MKLLSFRQGATEGYGAVSDDGVVDFRSRLGSRAPTLRDALAAGLLDEMRRIVETAKPDLSLSEIEYLPVIPNPARILCVGVNYRAHAQEAAREQTSHPSIFIRLTDSVVGHLQPLLRPHVSTDLDYEGELALVIGRAGRYIPAEEALSYVAGYSCFNDASVRDWQRHNPGPTPGKNFFHCGAFGPWLITTDEVPDPSALTLTTRVNGVEVQTTPTGLMIYNVPAIIAYVSSFTPLEPGDVISTGTPAGVGQSRNPPLWLKPGDVVEVTISGIGSLKNSVADEGQNF